MNSNCIRILIAVALISSVFVGCGTAATTVTITPDQITPGGMFTIQVNGLPDFVSIILQISGVFAVTPGNTFNFSFTGMQWPVDITESNSTVQLVNTAYNRVALNETESDGTIREYIVEGNSVNGVYNAVIPDIEVFQENESEEDHNVMFSGTAASNANAITASVTVQLQKEGADNFAIPVHVTGINYGNVLVNCFVNNALITTKSIEVRPIPSAPVYENTPYQVNPNNIIQPRAAINFL
jgi:hypothetical protein